jgi:hypothetical protein
VDCDSGGLNDENNSLLDFNSNRHDLLFRNRGLFSGNTGGSMKMAIELANDNEGLDVKERNAIKRACDQQLARLRQRSVDAEEYEVLLRAIIKLELLWRDH